MTKQFFAEMENLRMMVLRKGQKTHDRVRIPLENIASKIPAGWLLVQVREDFKRQYKFYDALAMWLGQKDYWTQEENVCLQVLAEKYLRDK